MCVCVHVRVIDRLRWRACCGPRATKRVHRRWRTRWAARTCSPRSSRRSRCVVWAVGGGCVPLRVLRYLSVRVGVRGQVAVVRCGVNGVDGGRDETGLSETHVSLTRRVVSPLPVCVCVCVCESGRQRVAASIHSRREGLRRLRTVRHRRGLQRHLADVHVQVADALANLKVARGSAGSRVSVEITSRLNILSAYALSA